MKCALLLTKKMLAIGCLLCACATAQAVECRTETVGQVTVSACRVDLNNEQLRLFWRDGSGQPYRQFSSLRDALGKQGSKLLFAVNAGMYKPDFSPVGLFVADGQELVPLNRHVGSGNFSQQPNGVFLVDGNSARVLTTEDYGQQKPRASFATQSGPMLVHEGEITTSEVMNPKSQWRKIRNGVCAPAPNQVAFVISDEPVSFFEFAGYFRDHLHCREALYLDGTISSLYSPQLGRDDHFSDMGPMLGVVVKTP
ncbi:MAG: hypothetical protein QOF42_1665 [Gammaproteobacteria bacterium]|jgi:uncharacterized protein YigE (DUF2233 family)|nr:hypothetical protein [Gammaproteobacteria bacterium]